VAGLPADRSELSTDDHGRVRLKAQGVNAVVGAMGEFRIGGLSAEGSRQRREPRQQQSGR